MSWVHSKDVKRKAKKKHVCYLCARRIEPGETYIRRHGIIEGQGRIDFPMHDRCEAVTESWDDGDWECFDIMGFREEMADFYA
jgi:hypothetical protein